MAARFTANPRQDLTDTGRNTVCADQPTVIYTLTDEAPLLATYAFLPIVRAFAEPAGITIQTSDISVAARILAEFSDYLTDEQRV
ncbi:MAG TPA: NADP-dependent isocitrate dehydrogenase, partial [Mycobacterium sp.]|nr:NADP-dependent isocitrate dehydrogenase [Mycobacterium sp.]